MKLSTALTLLTLTLGPSLAVAQPEFFYRRPEAREQKSRVSFSGQVLFGVDANINNLGNIAFPDAGGDPNVLLYNDGYIALNPNGGPETGNFQFDMDNARYDGDGYVTEFDLTRYRSETIGTSAEADLSSAYGWEIAYDYQFGTQTDRLRLGFRAGFSINKLEFSSNSTVEGRLIVQKATVQVPGGSISYEEGGQYQGSGAGGGPTIDPSEDLTQGPEEEVVEPVWNGEDIVVPSQVNSLFTVNGLLANARLGPTLSMRLFWDIYAELSAGLMGVYYTSEITMRERLLNLPTNESLFANTNAEEFETGTDGEFLLGFYGEGLLRYQATERVSLYGSLIYMSLDDPKSDALQEVDYQISFETPMLATAGVAIRF